MFENILKAHGQKSEKELLLTIIENQHTTAGLISLEFHLLKSKIEALMTKAEFIQGLTDLKTEVGVVGTKVDVLEQKINSSSTDVDPEIVAAFTDLKSSVDSLSTKADNTPVAPPAEPVATQPGA